MTEPKRKANEPHDQFIKQFEIWGRIDRLDIISSQGDLVEKIESINLAAN